MNPTLMLLLAAGVPTLVVVTAVAFGTWKVLTRIRQAVVHLEQHLGEPADNIPEPDDFERDQTRELRAAMDRGGFFAPNPREGS